MSTASFQFLEASKVSFGGILNFFGVGVRGGYTREKNLPSYEGTSEDPKPRVDAR